MWVEYLAVTVSFLLIGGFVVWMVASVRSGLFGARRTTPATPPANMTPADETALEREITRLLLERKKIQAVKELRDRVPMPLAEAKRTVDMVQRSGRLRLPWRPLLADDDDVYLRARALKLEGQIVEAVKLVRKHTGANLMEAKQLVDAM